jgi:nicotinate-nucleotide--dimethylbenzimidazole phosphoribosyltransferase
MSGRGVSGAEGAGREAIARVAARVPAFDADAASAAQRALDAKTKPRASLGRLEQVACRLAGMRGDAELISLEPAIVVCAADHGIAAEGVSAFPQEVTEQMLRNFAAGGAAVCVLARRAGARLVVADFGVRSPVDDPAILDRRVRPGTANSTRGPAMSEEEMCRAVVAGIELAEALAAEGVGLLALGEMGIGNTTAASALSAALLRCSPNAVCGRGTGLDADGVARKRAAVWRALEANVVSPYDPLGAVAGVGGLEIAALVGLVLGCAANRVPVLVDGFITAAAASTAVYVEERCREFLIASHLSPEPGHQLLLDALDLEPLLDFEMRLGEGSGAALALPLVLSAAAILTEMASFEQAGVTDAGA